MANKRSYTKALAREIRNIQLTKSERVDLSILIESRRSISGVPTRPFMVMEQATGAMKFVDALFTRAIKQAWAYVEEGER